MNFLGVFSGDWFVFDRSSPFIVLKKVSGLNDGHVPFDSVRNYVVEWSYELFLVLGSHGSWNMDF